MATFPATTIDDIPIEMTRMILSYLDYVDRKRTRRVCRLWNELIEDLPKEIVLLHPSVTFNGKKLGSLPCEPEVQHVIIRGDMQRPQFVVGPTSEVTAWSFLQYSDALMYFPKFPSLKEITFYKCSLYSACLLELFHQVTRLSLTFKSSKVVGYVGGLDFCLNDEQLAEAVEAIVIPDLTLNAEVLHEQLWLALDNAAEPISADDEALIVRLFPNLLRGPVLCLFLSREPFQDHVVFGTIDIDLDTLRLLKPWTKRHLLRWTSNSRFHVPSNA